MTAPERPLLECLELDHVVLRVRDPAASRRFYTELLGLTLDHVNEPLGLTQLRCGRHLLDLLPLGAGGGGDPTGALDHVCLSVRCADLEAVAAHLRAAGVPVEGPVARRRGAFGEGPSLYIRDPDGYRIELKPR